MIGFENFIGVFFVLACAAYWIFEREHAIRLVTSLLPRPRRKVVRDTWDLIDAKLGAYIRGQALLVTLVATTSPSPSGRSGCPSGCSSASSRASSRSCR